MNRMLFLGIVFVVLSNLAYAQCDLTQFRWECEVDAHKKPTKSTPSLVYCGNSQVYVTREAYDLLVRYHRANVNTVLTINNEYSDSPCVPAGRY